MPAFFMGGSDLLHAFVEPDEIDAAGQTSQEPDQFLRVTRGIILPRPSNMF